MPGLVIQSKKLLSQQLRHKNGVLLNQKTMHGVNLKMSPPILPSLPKRKSPKHGAIVTFKSHQQQLGATIRAITRLEQQLGETILEIIIMTQVLRLGAVTITPAMLMIQKQQKIRI